MSSPNPHLTDSDCTDAPVERVEPQLPKPTDRSVQSIGHCAAPVTWVAGKILHRSIQHLQQHHFFVLRLRQQVPRSGGHSRNLIETLTPQLPSQHRGLRGLLDSPSFFQNFAELLRRQLRAQARLWRLKDLLVRTGSPQQAPGRHTKRHRSYTATLVGLRIHSQVPYYPHC